MNKPPIQETILRLLAIVAPDADVTALQPKVSFRDQLEIDSIDFLHLMMALEKAFKVTIPDIDDPKLSTLQGCMDYLGVQLAVTEAGAAT